MVFIKRNLQNSILKYIDKYPIIGVTGPRQSGKSTMLKNMFPDYTYLSMENKDIRDFAFTDPNGFFDTYKGRLILDEIQRIPELFSYLQTQADESNIMGNFIISGSQNFLLMQNITQSLAGRVALFKLLPFDFKEMSSNNFMADDYANSMTKGFYPAIYDRNIPSNVFYENYIKTYVEKDASQIINLRDLKLFRNFIALCASRAGQLLNLNSIAKECGISHTTVRSWISVLESSYIIFLLSPYHENFSKRIVKSQKLYFYDTGLLLHILGISKPESLTVHAQKGNLFENMIISEIFKQNEHQYLLKKFWFWRDSKGNEVDLCIQDEDKLHAIEIKATKTITSDLFKGLNHFEKVASNKVSSKTLVYAGNNSQNRSYAKIQAWNSVYNLLN